MFWKKNETHRVVIPPKKKKIVVETKNNSFIFYGNSFNIFGEWTIIYYWSEEVGAVKNATLVRISDE